MAVQVDIELISYLLRCSMVVQVDIELISYLLRCSMVVQINVEDSDKAYAICSSVGDSHIMTFDGTWALQGAWVIFTLFLHFLFFFISIWVIRLCCPADVVYSVILVSAFQMISKQQELSLLYRSHKYNEGHKNRPKSPTVTSTWHASKCIGS